MLWLPAWAAGSNAMGMFAGFLNDPVDIYGVEPLGARSWHWAIMPPA